jgi:hypothetical protein
VPTGVMLPSEEPDSARHSIAAYWPASPTARVIDDLPLPWEGTNLAWVASVCAQNRVAILWSLRGTQRGEYRGAPARGNGIFTSGVDIFRIVDGNIAEIWTVWRHPRPTHATRGCPGVRRRIRDDEHKARREGATAIPISYEGEGMMLQTAELTLAVRVRRESPPRGVGPTLDGHGHDR